MRHATEVPATLPMDALHDRMPTSLTTPALLTPWRRLALLLHGLQTWRAVVTRRHASARQNFTPAVPRQPTPVDILAQKYTFLYACSLSG
jgi:hypothetical protein